MIAIAIIAPNVIWQWRHGWPFLELGARRGHWPWPCPVRAHLSPEPNHADEPWRGGCLDRRARRAGFRAQVATLSSVCLTVGFSARDPDRACTGRIITPARCIRRCSRSARWVIEASASAVWLRGALASLVIAAGLIGMPLAIPILPVDTLVAYEANAGIQPGSLGESQAGGTAAVFWRHVRLAGDG